MTNKKTMENKELEKGQECGMCEGCSCGQCEGGPICGGYGTCGGGYGACGGGCQQMYGMHCGGRHYVVRWILGIVILTLVFVAGIKVGQFGRDMRDAGFGYHMNKRVYTTTPGYGMMQIRSDSDANVQYRYGMMQGTGVQKLIPATQE